MRPPLPIGSTPPSVDSTRCIVTYRDARRIIRASRGRAFYLYLYMRAPVLGDEGQYYDHIVGYVPVPRNTALTYLEKVYPDRLREKAGVRVSWSDRCFFIG